jgi:NADH-quinone oxidoreductase subunit N
MEMGMGMSLGSVLPELLLLGGALAILIFALATPRHWQRFAPHLSLATLAATAWASGAAMGAESPTTFFDTYAVDDAAVWAKLVILAVAALSVLLARDWFATDARQGEMYTLLLLSTLGAIVLAGAADLMELLLGVLLTSVTGFALTAFHRASPRAVEAAIKYYLLGALANGFMAFGAVLLFGMGGSTLFIELREGLTGTQSWALAVAVGFVSIGIVFKLGAVPAHAWMPDVADGAPAPMAAFLTAAPKVGALIVLARLVAVLPESDVGWRTLVAVLAAATMTLGNLAALRQDDVRRLLGWSSVSQSGYALMAVVALGRSDLAVPSLIYFLAAYVLGNVAAFGVVVELRGLQKRASFAGLSRARPWLAFALVLAFLSFIGVPPLAGFVGKLALFAAAIEAGYAWLAVLAAANTVLSIAYYLRVIGPAYLQKAGPEVSARLGVWSTVSTFVSAAALIVLGLASQPLLDALIDLVLFPL